MSEPKLPIVRPPDEETPAVNVHGVLLAAGTSSRFGEENKLLAQIRGKPIVWWAAKTLVRSELSDVTVVVGHEGEQVVSALDGLPVKYVKNEQYANGQASSVAVGVRAARQTNPAAILIALGDMPHVSPATVSKLMRTYATGAGLALASAYEGIRGNPVLFDRKFFDDLEGVTGDTGARDILLDAPSGVLVETEDPGVRLDIDDQADLPDHL